jgi:hypothetical protein
MLYQLSLLGMVAMGKIKSEQVNTGLQQPADCFWRVAGRSQRRHNLSLSLFSLHPHSP